MAYSNSGLSENILQRIRQQMPVFSKKQQLVANYILSHHEDSAFLTSAELAQKSGTSESSVIRFSVSLGFKKYTDMQREIRSIVKGTLHQIDRLEKADYISKIHRPIDDIASSMRTDVLSTQKTLMMLDSSVVNDVVKLLSTANNVFAVATHGELCLAQYFVSSLSWIRENVFLLTGAHDLQFDMMSNIKPGDVIVALSFPPYPLNTVNMLKLATQQKAIGIAITDTPASPLSQWAEYCFYVQNEQVSFADNSAPTISLISGLLSAVSNQTYEKSMKRLSHLNHLWLQAGIYTELQKEKNN